MTTWLDDIESEDLSDAWDSDDLGDSEGADDSEESRADRARRERARRIALARRRSFARQQPPRRTVASPVGPRDTVTAIRELDLRAKVSDDSLRAALERANARSRRANYVVAASLAIDQALDTFGDDLAGHDFVRAGMRSLPLVLLQPERGRKGVEGVLLDPRFIGLTGVVALVAAGKLHHRDAGVTRISVLEHTASGSGRFQAVATDKNGRQTAEPISFRSQDPTVLSVAADGSFTAVSDGSAFVTASAGGHEYTFAVTVHN